MNKIEKRKEIKQMQKKLTSEYCHFADMKICDSIINLDEFKKSKTIFCFINLENEINTRPIIEQAWTMGKSIAVPKCTGQGIMELYNINSYDDLESGSYGIREPKKSCPCVSPEQIDFAVIPCISCDLNGWRLGHGGGYYDRYLEHTTFMTAVICRQAVLSESIPHENYDRRMNIVVTEETVRYINSSICNSMQESVSEI